MLTINKKIVFFTFFSVILNIPLIGQVYTVHTIPDSLKKDAVAVVRDYSVVLSQSNINNAEYSVKKVVTVLNRQGDHFANFHVIGDKFREYSDISGILMDANGNVIKKIKKGDFSVSSLKDSYTLLSDSYDIFYTCQSPTYPYTIQYTYQVKMKNGVISYPPFFPFDSYQQAVEQASMKMEIPANIQLRYKSNYNDNFKIDKKENKNIYSVSVSGLKAKLFEAFAPGYDKIFPFIMFAPTDFCYDSHCGNMSDWKHYGLWVSDLLKGRDAIPNELSEKIKDLTKDAKTPAEKVKIVYEYLQNNTRYVSIQLGIGGLQPIDATSVYKTRYGDCKGLTNLMKAMLKSINIQSNYCEIYSGDRNQRLYSDFANVNQTNHAILLVPMEKDSIWLECTSQTLPFGYIHDGIAGHDALVINEHGEGGKICRLPSYTKEQNKSSTKLIVNVNENGSAEGEVCFKRYLHNYYNAKDAFLSNDRKKQTEYINAYIKLPQIEINKIMASEDRSALPSCTMKADFAVPDFANKTGSRLFIPLSPINKGSLNFFSSDRRDYDIHMDKNYSTIDTVIYNIPELYTIESLPKDIEINMPFGSFSAKTKWDNNKLIYYQKIILSSGEYDKGQYMSIKNFFAQINSAIQRRFVLKLKEGSE